MPSAPTRSAIRPRRTCQESRNFGSNNFRSPCFTLLADDFHEDAFSAAPVKFAVEDLFPGTEVQFALGDSNDDLATHDLPLQVRVGVVFTGAVVLILCRGRVRR